MKILLPVLFGAVCLFAAGCASEADQANGVSPISGRVGVNVASRNSSRVQLSRPELNPPPY